MAAQSKQRSKQQGRSVTVSIRRTGRCSTSYPQRQQKGQTKVRGEVSGCQRNRRLEYERERERERERAGEREDYHSPIVCRSRQRRQTGGTACSREQTKHSIVAAVDAALTKDLGTTAISSPPRLPCPPFASSSSSASWVPRKSLPTYEGQND